MRILGSIVHLVESLHKLKGHALTRRQLIAFGAGVSAGTLAALPLVVRKAYGLPVDQPGVGVPIPDPPPDTAPPHPDRPLTLGTNPSSFPDPLVDSGTQWKRDQSRLVLAFSRPTRKDHVAALLLGSGLVLEDEFYDPDDSELGQLRGRINFTDKFFWVRSIDGKTITPQVVSAFEASNHASLEWIGPVYQAPDVKRREGLRCPTPHLLQLTPAPPTTHETLARILKSIVIDGTTYHLEESPNAFRSVTGRRQYQLKVGSQIPVYRLLKRLRERTEILKEVRIEYFGMVSALGSYLPPTDDFYAQSVPSSIISMPPVFIGPQ